MIRKLLLALAFCFALPTIAFANACVWSQTSGSATWDNSNTANWTSCGGTFPQAADSVTFNATSCSVGPCTITVAATFNSTNTITSLTFGACTNTCVIDFSANNPNVNIVNSGGLSTVNGSGTGTRTLNMGNGVWTVGANALASNFSWNFITTTGLTLNINSSSIVLVGGAGASTNNYFGGKSWGPLTITGSSTYPSSIIAFESGNSANDTFTSMTVNAPAYLTFRSAATFTFTNGITVSRASWAAPIYLASDGSGATANNVTIAVGAASTLNYGVFRNITGATNAITANPGINLGSNIGTVTITNPSAGSGGGFIIGG